MSPRLETMLVDEVIPRLRAAAPSVPKTGAEDDAEITADMTANAARMMTAAEKAGKKFSPGNVAYFASRAARVGRRSTGMSKTDAMAPATLINGRVRHEALDAEMPDPLFREADGPDTLHDIVWGAGGSPDPAEEAGRNLDWEAFLATRPPRQRVAIVVLAAGGTMREAGKRCGIGDSAAALLKKRLAEAIVEFFGNEVIAHLLGGARPAWEPDLRAVRERHACQCAEARHETVAA